MIFFLLWKAGKGGGEGREGLNRAQADKPLHFFPTSTVWAKAWGQELAKTIFNSKLGSDTT